MAGRGDHGAPRSTGDTRGAGTGDPERWGFWFTLCILILYPLNTLLRRRDPRGWEHLPREGGVLLALNHVSVTDPLIICREVFDAGRLPHYLAKDSLFRIPGARQVLYGAKQIPVSRGTVDAARALDAAVEALERGLCVIIYPEGTTSRDPELWPMQARTGVARLALTEGVPVLPVAQWGAHRFYRRGYRPHAFRFPTISTRVGEPIDLSAYEGREQTPELLREVTDLIMSRITAQLAEIRVGETRPRVALGWRRGEPEPTLVDLEPVDRTRRRGRAA